MSFLKDMYTANTGKSSKRLIATIMILSAIIYIGYLIFVGDVTNNILNLINSLIYSGLILFGTTTADKMIDKQNKKT